MGISLLLQDLEPIEGAYCLLNNFVISHLIGRLTSSNPGIEAKIVLDVWLSTDVPLVELHHLSDIFSTLFFSRRAQAL